MNRRASALFPVLGLVALVALPFVWRYLIPPTAVVAAPTLVAPLALHPLAPTEGQEHAGLEVALLRAGISPESLAAVGAPTQGLFALIESARTHFAANAQTLAAADAAYGEAKPACDRLSRLIQAGKASQEDVANYQSQLAAVASASAAQQAALNALFEATTLSLSPDQRTLLQRIHEAHTWGLPTEFSAVERSQQAWVELRSALANERFAAKFHEEELPAAQALLSAVRSEPGVAAAKTGIDTNLVYITSTWNSALAD